MGKDIKGLVFDIQRASIQDGPGIRTTVFLKGCSLDCIWCHNPEGKSSSPQLSIKQDKCQLCGKCVEVCKNDSHQIVERKHLIDHNKCDTCGDCLTACPQGGIEILGSEMTVDEVMNEVGADIEFYKNSGGGVTISGGEALLQYRFSQQLLKQCKEKQIHTCLETSGFTSIKVFEESVRDVDLLLFDYKLTDTDLHKKYTGVDNKIILTNLDYAYHSKIPITLRCLIIPGINDTKEHFSGICEMDKKYPLLHGIEIMTYHNMGNQKAENIGMFNNLELENVPQKIREEWIGKLNSMGCNKAKLG